jgi:hypothetical protein
MMELGLEFWVTLAGLVGLIIVILTLLRDVFRQP